MNAGATSAPHRPTPTENIAPINAAGMSAEPTATDNRFQHQTVNPAHLTEHKATTGQHLKRPLTKRPDRQINPVPAGAAEKAVIRQAAQTAHEAATVLDDLSMNLRMDWYRLMM